LIRAGGMPAGVFSPVSHSWTTLAIFVFLQTMMNTGGRGSSLTSSHAFRRSSQRPASMAMGVQAYLRTASGLGFAFFPPRSAGVSLGRIQRQMLK